MARFDKLRAGPLVNLVGELGRQGFKFDIQKFPEMRNKWKIVIEFPAGAKANLSTVLGNNREMLKLQDAVRMGGGTFLFNLSAAVGRFGENAALRALRGGNINHRFSVGGQSFNMKNMTLGSTIQLQNRSGQGLDVMTKITAPRPPAPRWVAIEVKSKMGPDVAFPSLSEAQQRSNYLREKVRGALRGIDRAEDAIDAGRSVGRTWEDLIPFVDDIEDFSEAVNNRQVTKILAQVELDRLGNQVGDIITGAWR